MDNTRSVIIIGKGASVQRCTKQYVDSFDEVAICGRPPYIGYEHLISNHADWDFTNDSGLVKYSPELMHKLGLKWHVNTGGDSPIKKEFKYKTLDPSTGILAFNFFAEIPEYTHIALVGFDLFQKNKRVYYFEFEDEHPSQHYLWYNGTYDKEMTYLKESGHKTDLTYEFITAQFKNYPDKKFSLITDYPFEKFDNVEMVQGIL